MIGEVADGLFIDAGTSGHGFRLAPALGGLVADLVMHGAVTPGWRSLTRTALARVS